MKVTIIPIVIGTFGTIVIGTFGTRIIKRHGGIGSWSRVETIQMTALLRTDRDESWRLEETCCHSNSSEKPSANTDVKNSKGVNSNNNNNNKDATK